MYKMPHKVYCTECGSLIENKYFSLEELLNGFGYNWVTNVLDIGAFYGENVLPNVPNILGKSSIMRPDLEQMKQPDIIRSYTGSEDDAPKGEYRSVKLNISSIIAQFYLQTGFKEIYDMLDLIQYHSPLNENDQRNFDIFCERFVQLPGVRLGNNNPAVIVGFLQNILADAKKPVGYDLQVIWRSEEINGNAMPSELMISYGANGHKNMKCCCDKCHSEIPCEFGAYEQRIVGILGTQQVGKTSYLMALADAIENNELVENDEGKKIPMTVKAVTDAQRGRVEKNAGALWLYQNGFPVEKTMVKGEKAPALTWIIESKEKAFAPVMYTLADIPGEAFADDVDPVTGKPKYTQEEIEKATKLLKASKSLIAVINSLQTNSEWAKASAYEERRKSIKAKSHHILNYLNKFVEKAKGSSPNGQEFKFQKMPVAVVLTASDLIEEGNLRKAFKISYDIKKLSPLLWEPGNENLSYNTEAMGSAIRSVREHINTSFGQFADMLSQMVAGEIGKVAAFAVSSGTQHATTRYPVATAKEQENGIRGRYDDMKADRFGVTGPLLWILACDGILPLGRTNCDPKRRVHIVKQLRESLYE